jgi:hypothetical protein
MKSGNIMTITNGKIQISAEYWPDVRKKPVLAVFDPEAATVTKYASFSNEEAAEQFMKILCDFIGIDRRAYDEKVQD